MRVSDIVNQLRRRGSEGISFVRYPFQTIWRFARKRGQNTYENLEFGEKKKNNQALSNNGSITENNQTTRSSSQELGKKKQFKSSFQAIDNQQHLKSSTIEQGSFSALGRSKRSVSSSENTLISNQENSLPLELGEELQGKWGAKYTVTDLLHSNSWKYLYEGTKQNSNDPVFIYIYILDKDKYNKSQIRERQKAFENITDANIRLGHDRDFRILKIEDAFSENRALETFSDNNRYSNLCYLVVKKIPHTCTLSEHFKNRNTSLSLSEFEQIIKQVLQSLKYLHSIYRVYWKDHPSEKGLCHGNLNFDSLWLRNINQQVLIADRPQFFIYLSSFKLWEHLFSPEEANIYSCVKDLGEITDDLEALGWIAFCLLYDSKVETKKIDPQFPPNINLQDNKYWNSKTKILKPFISQLIGIGSQPRFQSAQAAETALNSLQLGLLKEEEIVAEKYIKEEQKTQKESPTESPTESTKFTSNFPHLLKWILLGTFSIVFLSLFSLPLFKNIFSRREVPKQIFSCQEENNCRLADIQTSRIGDNKLQYNAEISSSWIPIIEQERTDSSAPSTHTLFESLLEERNSELKLVRENLDGELQDTSLSKYDASQTELIEQIQQRKIDFALIQIIDEETELYLNNAEEIDFDIVSFDAIAVFVPFSDGYRQQSIPNKLNGEINIEDLKSIFTDGENRSSSSIKYKLYMKNANDSQIKHRDVNSLIDNFKTLLLDTDSEYNKFERLYRNNQYDNIYSSLLQDFESQSLPDGTIGIGFDKFSNMFGQCSVYPLAIKQKLKQTSLIVESNGQLLNPETDLCGDKGSYWPNVNAFPMLEIDNKMRLNRDLAYPLAIELAVAYRKCSNEANISEGPCNEGHAFAQMLQTVEGQYILSEMGLIPLMPIEEIRQVIWSNYSD